MGKTKFLITGALALTLGISSTGLVKAVEDAKPTGGTTAVTPKANKVSLNVEVYDGNELKYTFVPYKDVDVNTKVDMNYLKENVKLDGYDLEWQGAPITLDKDYTIQVKGKAQAGTKEEEPAEQVTPSNPAKDPAPAPGKTNGKQTPAAKKGGVKGTVGKAVRPGNKRLPKTSAVK